MYYRNAQAALVVYDVTKPSSLVKARHWVAELQRQASPGIVVAVAGNKVDLVDEAAASNASAGGDGEDADGQAEEEGGRKVSREEAEKFAEEEGCLFFETSAKTGSNVAEVFTAIANAIPEAALKGRGQPAAGAAAGAAATSSGARDEGSRVQLGRGDGVQKANEGCAC